LNRREIEMSYDFSGQTALVTGASRGIGRAIALRLARDGAGLLGHFRSAAADAESLRAEVQALGRECRLLQADLAALDEVDRLAGELAGTRLDILVNNAGVWVPSALGSTTRGQLRTIVDVNLTAVFWLTQALLPHLNPGARIVNVSSVAGAVGVAGGRSLYGATKAAMNSFTRNWALELAPRRIRVNAVAPGYVLTDMTAAHFADPDIRDRAVKRHPFGRLGNAEEVADVVAFLCSNESAWITGQIVNVSGGFVI
jgi:3-oxoacyl-[acyl-carrier protein] reductase